MYIFTLLSESLCFANALHSPLRSLSLFFSFVRSYRDWRIVRISTKVGMKPTSAAEMLRYVADNGGILNTISNLIIRPIRAVYEPGDLGPSVFRLGNKNTTQYERVDLDLYNMQGMLMACSWFRPLKMTRPLPCVVYCHANCGSRTDGLDSLYLLKHGFTLFTFDFCGSGLSDGEYISLGFYERQDLAEVVSYLQLQSQFVDGVALWGRSMGAVTAIMYAARDPSVRAIVCDSAFASLRLLIDDLVRCHSRYLPGIIVRTIVNRIRKRILDHALFDINDLDTVKYAASSTVPALIFHGRDDDFVSCQHGEAIRDAYRGECVYECITGGHNDERSEKLREFVAAYLTVYTVEKPLAAREGEAARLRAQQQQMQVENVDLAASHATESSAAASGHNPTNAQPLPISVTKPCFFTDPTKAPEAWTGSLPPSGAD